MPEATIIPQQTYYLDDLEVDPVRRVVTRDGEEIQLGRLTFDLLLLLIEESPGIVTWEQVIDRLWDNRHVTQETLRQRVKLLRRALQDDPDNPRYFSVIRGQGYRLLPEVRIAEGKLAPASPNWRPWAAGVAVAIVLVLASLIVTRTLESDADQVYTETIANSIAVLPFENLSGDGSDDAFVEGFHNDLLTQLAKLQSFDVISRTSVLGYRENKKNLRLIGQELGVSTVLEGSIQRSGNSVRINAQLIDAYNDKHIWANLYDRELTTENLFEIQSEIAAAIAGALNIQLSRQERDQLDILPTDNLKAYNHYLSGMRQKGDRNEATNRMTMLAAFRNAVDEDPRFALAWAELGRVHSAVYFFQGEDELHSDLALDAINRAFELRPALPEAHLAMGYYYYHCLRDFQAALDEWRHAENGMPGSAEIDFARANVYFRQGRLHEAIANMESVVRLDPANFTRLITLQWYYTLVNNFDRAEEIGSRINSLAPDITFVHARLADIAMFRDGDASLLRERLALSPRPVETYPMVWLGAIYERDYAEALAILERWNVKEVDTHRFFRPGGWFYGATLELAGDSSQATQHFRDALAMTEARISENPESLNYLITRADLVARLGDSESAIRLANTVQASLPTSDDASLGSNLHLYAIRVYLAAGDYERAISELDAYLAGPRLWTIEGLLPDPRLDPIRNHPDFLAIVEKYRSRS